jgi:hypothetical protein
MPTNRSSSSSSVARRRRSATSRYSERWWQHSSPYTTPGALTSVGGLRDNRIYSFHQQLAPVLLSQAAITFTALAGNTIYQLAPSLSSLDQASTYTALFDQYKIAKVTHTFRPQFNKANFSAATDLVPLIYTVIDYDDTAVVGEAGLRQYQTCQLHECERFSVTYTPHVANALSGGGVFTSYGNIPAQWIDCNSGSVVHYGLKVGITAGNSGQTNLQKWELITYIEIHFKNVR